MNELQSSDDMKQQLVSYLLNLLEEPERLRCEQAIATDPDLAEEFLILQRTLALLPQATRMQPPARLRARMMRAASVQMMHKQPASRWTLAGVSLLAAAASIVCVVLVVDRTRQQRQQGTTELEQRAAALLREPNVVLPFVLQGQGAAAAAQGFVYLDLDARRAAMAMRNVPAAPAGQRYYLWAELESGRVLCGQFSPDAAGAMVAVFPIPVGSYTSGIKRLMLTLEAAENAAAPAGPVLMSSKVS